MADHETHQFPNRPPFPSQWGTFESEFMLPLAITSYHFNAQGIQNSRVYYATYISYFLPPPLNLFIDPADLRPPLNRPLPHRGRNT